MYKVYFYKNQSGKQPALDFIIELKNKDDKSSRILFNKIVDYIQVLSLYGLSAGQPYIKHIEGMLWELRPRNKRFFFVAWTGNEFIILHQFTKQSRKMPKSELERARREMEDIINGNQK